LDCNIVYAAADQPLIMDGLSASSTCAK
jgi:hypothetical protein